MAIAGPPYHVAVVVADLDRAMNELGELLGLTWHEPFGGAGYQLLHGEIVDSNVRVTYSRQGPPYLELLQQCPGTVWAETGLHHIGIWVDDAHAESKRFAAAGADLEAVGVTSDGTWVGGCYHRTSDGLRVELVDIATSGPKLARYLSGGSYA